jgi:hypothetical protein
VTRKNFGTEVLEQLRCDGSDTSKRHDFAFYLYVPTERAATEVGETLRTDGYDVEIRQAAVGDNWLCLATASLIPDAADFDDIERLFTGLAQKFKGEFDGWEADVIISQHGKTEPNGSRLSS